MVFFTKRMVPVLLLGGLAGFLNGLLGAGGGIPLVLGLRLLFGKKAANGKRFFVTALAVMLPLSVFSVWRYIAKSPLPTAVFNMMPIPALLGGAGGAWLMGYLPTGILGRIFAAAVALSGVLLLF